jgi:hypothetical protein
MARDVTVPPKRRPLWAVVEHCLVEIHGLSRRDARQRVAWLLEDLASTPPALDSEIIYHAEQFDIACNLAGRDLDRAEHDQTYRRILLRPCAGVGLDPAEVVAGM